jgi:hypothetical protein
MPRIICVIVLSAAVAGCSASPPTPPSAFIVPGGPIPRPIVTSVSPARGSTGGGTPVTIIGSGFQVGGAITLGGTRQVVSVHGSMHLSLTTTAHDAGIVEMVVTGPQGQVETFAAAFEYATPQALDFNGNWEGLDHGIEFQVVITGNVVTRITCGGVDVTLSAPLVVRNGAFSLTTGPGVDVVSGRIVSDRMAIGDINTTACPGSGWQAFRK